MENFKQLSKIEYPDYPNGDVMVNINCRREGFIAGAEYVAKQLEDRVDGMAEGGFAGWSEAEINGYKTALETIRDFIAEGR